MRNIILFIDTSLSIEKIMHDYTKAVMNIIGNIEKIDPASLLTVITFNETVEYVGINQAVSSYNSVNLVPKGNTSLYDCLSTSIHRLNQFYEETKAEPPIVVILSDGRDTSSRLVDARLTALEILRMKVRGWKFVFVGTDPGAVILGKRMGCNVCVLYDTSPQSIANVSQVVAEIVEHRANHDAEIDIRTLTDSMAEMKI